MYVCPVVSFNLWCLSKGYLRVENSTISSDWTLGQNSKTVIADICHHSHHWWWFIFFKPVPYFAQGMRNFGLFWPILAFFCERARCCGVLLLGGGVPKLTNIRCGKSPQISQGHLIILNEICEQSVKMFSWHGAYVDSSFNSTDWPKHTNGSVAHFDRGRMTFKVDTQAGMVRGWAGLVWGRKRLV